MSQTIQSILLDSIDKVKRFVTITNRFKYNIELHSGRYVVDAKSVMGVLSLDLNKPLELVVFADNSGVVEVTDILLSEGMIV